MTKTRNAGQPYGGEEKEEEALKGEGIDAYKNHIDYDFCIAPLVPVRW